MPHIIYVYSTERTYKHFIRHFRGSVGVGGGGGCDGYAIIL